MKISSIELLFFYETLPVYTTLALAETDWIDLCFLPSTQAGLALVVPAICPFLHAQRAVCRAIVLRGWLLSLSKVTISHVPAASWPGKRTSNRYQSHWMHYRQSITAEESRPYATADTPQKMGSQLMDIIKPRWHTIFLCGGHKKTLQTGSVRKWLLFHKSQRAEVTQVTFTYVS